MEYENLFNAIWRQAVADDTRNALKQAYTHGVKSAYDVYIAKAKDPIDLEDKRFKTIKKDIRDYAKLRSGDIENKIKQLVYQESQAWPDNQSLRKKDEEYRKLLRKLTLEVREFAKERMKKRWMKI